MKWLNKLLYFSNKNLNSTNQKITENDIQKIQYCLSVSKNENGFLALLNDKKFFFYPENSENCCFIMYGEKGNSYIAMGDPIGYEEFFEKAIKEFKEFCKKREKKCIFYEVDHSYIGNYLKNNMIISKIGERGKIILKNFSLEGSDMRKLRYSYNHLAKDNYIFKVITKHNNSHVLETLSNISKEWLKRKNASEKKFSIGHFNEEYIKNFDIAIVEKNGEIIAFTTLFGTPNKECLTLDLMRHRGNLENGVMEFFFVSLILYAKENNYAAFSLGIVPLSGIDKHILTPYKSVEHFIFNHEKHFYNFKGLKLFKDKFKPEWEPVYITYAGHLIFPLVLKDIISLTSGGIVSAIHKIEKS
ncbi:MAG: phosphatidylglycerol lysyltransferase domain-containing protein [Cetobacterium sp.]